MLLNVFLVFVCLQLANAVTEVKQCKPAAGQVISQTDVQFGDCEKSPCAVKRGTTVTIDMTFVAEDDFAAVTTTLTGTMMGVKHGYPGIDGKDGCDNLYSLPDMTKVSCPIQKGNKYLYRILMPIKMAFPKVTIPLHTNIKDKTSNRLAACFESVMKIT